MSKKTLLIVGAFLAVVAAIILLIYVFTSRDQRLGVTSVVSIEEKINLALEGSIQVSTNTFQLFANSNYYIQYFQSENKFSIVILLFEAEKIRPVAESKLLELLDINQLQACELDVDLGVPGAINPILASINYSLSFCDDGLEMGY